MALTKYQKHVRRELKKGKTMKQAAASWRKKKRGRKKRSRSSSSNRSTRKMGKKFNVSLTGAIAMGKLAAPAIPEIVPLIQLMFEGKWNSFQQKLEFIGQKYGKDMMGSVVLPIIIAIGGRAARKYLGMRKITGLGPVNLNI